MRPNQRFLPSLLVALAVVVAGCDAREASGGGGGILPVSGAHPLHLSGSELAEPITCGQCHNPAFEVTFPGALATANGATPTFNSAALTCSNVYCHAGGPQLPLGGGTVPVPVWEPKSVISCGACHSLPGDGTAAPWHPAVATGVQCALCHPGYTNTSVNTPLHVNGVANVQPPDVATNCAACHGDATRVLPDGAPAVLKAAPPVDRNGSSDTSQPGVGAHQAHLMPGSGAIATPIACTECHVVPADLAHVGPLASTPATLDWGPLASASGVAPTFDAATVTCTNYCHGAVQTGGSNTRPVWTKVDGTQARCGTCHGDPPTSGLHEMHASPNFYGVSCGTCHPTGYAPGQVGAAVVGIHVNGTVNMNATGFSSWNASAAGPNGWRGTATGCHGGTRYWYPGSNSSCQ